MCCTANKDPKCAQGLIASYGNQVKLDLGRHAHHRPLNRNFAGTAATQDILRLIQTSLAFNIQRTIYRSTRDHVSHERLISSPS